MQLNSINLRRDTTIHILKLLDDTGCHQRPACQPGLEVNSVRCTQGNVELHQTLELRGAGWELEAQFDPSG
jgi:hypothetical protein